MKFKFVFLGFFKRLLICLWVLPAATGCANYANPQNDHSLARLIITDIESEDSDKRLKGLVGLVFHFDEDFPKINKDKRLFYALKNCLNDRNVHVRLLAASRLSDIGTMNEEISKILRSEIKTQNTGVKIRVIQIIGKNKFILNQNIDIIKDSVKNDYEEIALKSISALKKLGEIDDADLIKVLLYRLSVLNKETVAKSSIIEVLSLVSAEKSKYVYEKISKIRVDEGNESINEIVEEAKKRALSKLEEKIRMTKTTSNEDN